MKAVARPYASVRARTNVCNDGVAKSGPGAWNEEGNLKGQEFV